jgi:formate/nitrite transporter
MSYNPPKEIVPMVVRNAVDKDHIALPRLLALAFLGGAYIALAGLLAVFVAGGVPGLGAGNPVLPKLFMGAVFPLGLMLVAIAGAELFTGNTAYFSAAVLDGKLRVRDLLRNWGFVYVGNFVGALFVAAVLGVMTGVLAPEPWRGFLNHLAETKTSAPFLTVFCKAIGCNWLVALAMWQAYAAKDVAGKVFGIWFPIMAFVVLGFEHCVANMFFIPTAMMMGAPISMERFLVGNLLPATLGNIVGGGLLVGSFYWYAYRNVPSLPIPMDLQPTPDQERLGV